VTALEKALATSPLIAIVRGRDPDACVATCRVLAEAGVSSLEVSLTTVEALAVIERVALEVGGHALLGAGTVLDPDDVTRVRDAGAQFVVTPALAASVPRAVEIGMPVLAGAMTPTEVHAAVNAGAGWVKLFPASVLGPDYVRALRDPYPGVRLVPVGGVGLKEAPAYLDAGAAAVGVGTPLCGDAPNGGDLKALRTRAEAFLAVVR
jgi:2-dehydro-3-deoxyphosphogluconate aldolase/(4S)-4-hydroxy-2-oxoglutarate aldolase